GIRRRQRRGRLYRSQGQLARLSRSLPPAWQTGGRGRYALRGDRGAGLQRRGRRLAGAQPHLCRDGRERHNRGAVRAPRGAVAAASSSAFCSAKPEFAPDAYRVGYSPMVTPTTVYDYHPESGALEVLKVQEIPSGYDSSQYATERLMMAARDGAKVPVSIVYK